MAEVPPPKRDAAAASEDEQNTKKQKTEGTGLKRADGTPWEPIPRLGPSSSAARRA